ncbi:hypothetical protein, partial [uncultured Haliea sp.]|uniref:hypothetical protein n=1 Tax=uncultured Haliea sp. TaxID=622616 RepID=UPI0030DA70B8
CAPEAQRKTQPAPVAGFFCARDLLAGPSVPYSLTNSPSMLGKLKQIAAMDCRICSPKALNKSLLSTISGAYEFL